MITDLLRHPHLQTFRRYAVVGILQNGAFYGLTLLLLAAGLAAWQAVAILFPVATTISFLANRQWSFEERARKPRQFQKYVLIYALAYPVSIAATWAQERAGLQPWLASLVTMGLSAVGIFAALNFWVFRTPADATKQPEGLPR